MPGYGNHSNKVFTAPLAIIKVAGVSIGKIRSLNFTENVQRGEVQGLGKLNLEEAPATSIRCQFTADSYLIDSKKFGTIQDPFWPTEATSNEEFANSILLGEVGVDLYVYSKIPKTTNGKIVTDIDEFLIGVASECFLNSKTMQIQEGQIGGKNISGIYLNPIF